MDWTYKHFNHQAVFAAPQQDVLNAARAVAAESLGDIEEMADGFRAKGYGAFHSEVVTFRVTPAANGTQVAVELRANRATSRGYMLWDIGGYYNGKIDTWFHRIAQRLGQDSHPALISKSTSSARTMPALAAGCIAWVVVGSCLGAVAIPLDRAFFPRWNAMPAGPLGAIASITDLLVGVMAFVYVVNPESRFSKSIRARSQRNQKDNQ